MGVKLLNFAAPTVSPYDVAPQPIFSPVAGIFWTANRFDDGAWAKTSAALGLASRDNLGGITQAAVGIGSQPGVAGTSLAGHWQNADWIAMRGYEYSDFATPLHVGVDDFTCVLSLDQNYGAFEFGSLLLGGRTLEAQQAELTLPAGADTVSVAGLPWQPQLVLLIAGYDGTHEGMNLSFGAATDTDQWAYAGYTEYLGDLFEKFAYSRLKSGSACIGIRSRGNTDWDAALTMTTDGFTLDATGHRPPEDITVWWLALYDSDPTAGFSVGLTDQASGGGDHYISGLTDVSSNPYLPQGVLLVSANKTDENLDVDNYFVIGGTDGTDERTIEVLSLGGVSDDVSTGVQFSDRLLWSGGGLPGDIDERFVAFLNGAVHLNSVVAGSHKIGYIAVAPSPGTGFLPCAPPIISVSRNTHAHTMIETTTIRAE